MKTRRFILLLVCTVVANLMFIVLSPNYVYPHVRPEMRDAMETVGFSLIPFFWGFYLLFAYRDLKERVLAYSAVAIATLWVGVGTNRLIQAVRERHIDQASFRVYNWPNQWVQATPDGAVSSASRSASLAGGA